jgi:hypothetical protein
MYFGLIGFGFLAGLLGILVGLVIQILFLLNLMRLVEAVQPPNRAMSPGLVWLNLIPVFSLGWMIYTVIKIKDSVGRENASRWGASVNEGNTHTVGLVYSILAAAAFVFSYGGYASRGFSVFAGLISIAVLVLWIMYWVKTNRLKRDLQMTAGRGYGPGGQYGPGGPYPPSGPSYGPGAAGYGGSYGASHTGQTGAGPTGQSVPTPPPPESPTTAPPSGEETPAPGSDSESIRKCSQCGNELNPDAAFCGTCGMPVPRE